MFFWNSDAIWERKYKGTIYNTNSVLYRLYKCSFKEYFKRVSGGIKRGYNIKMCFKILIPVYWDKI